MYRTAFAGISLYAQTDDSELTTCEEAIAEGEDFEDTMSVENVTDDGSAGMATPTSASSSNTIYTNNTSSDVIMQ